MEIFFPFLSCSIFSILWLYISLIFLYHIDSEINHSNKSNSFTTEKQTYFARMHYIERIVSTNSFCVMVFEAPSSSAVIKSQIAFFTHLSYVLLAYDTSTLTVRSWFMVLPITSNIYV